MLSPGTLLCTISREARTGAFTRGQGNFSVVLRRLIATEDQVRIAARCFCSAGDKLQSYYPAQMTTSYAARRRMVQKLCQRLVAIEAPCEHRSRVQKLTHRVQLHQGKQSDIRNARHGGTRAQSPSYALRQQPIPRQMLPDIIESNRCGRRAIGHGKRRELRVHMLQYGAGHSTVAPHLYWCVEGDCDDRSEEKRGEAGPHAVGSTGKAALPSMHSQPEVNSIHEGCIGPVVQSLEFRLQYAGEVLQKRVSKRFGEERFSPWIIGEPRCRYAACVEMVAGAYVRPQKSPPVAAYQFAAGTVDAAVETCQIRPMDRQSICIVQDVGFSVCIGQRLERRCPPGRDVIDMRRSTIKPESKSPCDAGRRSNVSVSGSPTDGAVEGAGAVMSQRCCKHETRVEATSQIRDWMDCASESAADGVCQCRCEGRSRFAVIVIVIGGALRRPVDLLANFRGTVKCDDPARLQFSHMLVQRALAKDTAFGQEFANANEVPVGSTHSGQHERRGRDQCAPVVTGCVHMQGANRIGRHSNRTLASGSCSKDEGAFVSCHGRTGFKRWQGNRTSPCARTDSPVIAGLFQYRSPSILRAPGCETQDGALKAFSEPRRAQAALNSRRPIEECPHVLPNITRHYENLRH